MVNRPAFLFDLDGTLVDSVYQHVLAWRIALADVGIELAVWKIHRKIGMSGGLFINALLRETERPFTAEEVARIQLRHQEAYVELAPDVRPLPGARPIPAAIHLCKARPIPVRYSSEPCRNSLPHGTLQQINKRYHRVRNGKAP